MSDLAARRTLAGLWLLDGALQLFPRMFTMFMVQSVLRPPLLGEPAWLAHLTQHVLVLGSEHIWWFNLGVAFVQVVLGLGLLLRGGQSTWPYWGSLLWCAAVWVFGEALGGLPTGQASLITGAPGSVVLYAVLTCVAWPRRRAASPARRRAAVALALAGFWALGAVLQAAPVFFTAPGLSGLLLGNINVYQPAWLNAWMRRGAALLAAHPVLANTLLIGAMAALALGLVLPSRWRRWVLVASIACSALIWVTGQAFGMLWMAMSTDPNTAPLVVVLAWYAWPERERPSANNGTKSPGRAPGDYTEPTQA